MSGLLFLDQPHHYQITYTFCSFLYGTEASDQQINTILCRC